MSIKILEPCLLFFSSFKQFVEFSLSSAAQVLKLRLQTNPRLDIYFDSNLLLLAKLFDLKMPIWFLDFVTYIILTNIWHTILISKTQPSTHPLQYFFLEEFCISTYLNSSTNFSQNLTTKSKQYLP